MIFWLGQINDLEKLLKKYKVNINSLDPSGRTRNIRNTLCHKIDVLTSLFFFKALHNAAITGSASIVKLLLEHKADANARDNNGSSVLHYACKCPIDNSDVLKTLLKRPDIQSKILFHHHFF